MRIPGTNYLVTKMFPKHSTIWAKKHFGNKPIVVAEIGCLYGENTISMFKELNIKKLYMIDPYEKYWVPTLNRYEEQEKQDEIKKKMLHNVYPWSSWIEFLEMKSTEAWKHIKEKIDYVYIDGGHLYQNVYDELNIYGKMLSKNGFLAGDDCNQYQVSLALHRYCKENNLKFKAVRTEFYLEKKLGGVKNEISKKERKVERWRI